MLLCFLPGSMAPLCLPPPPAAGPRAQDPPAGPWAPQDIRIDNSVLRRVQLGHGNEMNLHGTPATGPGHSPPGNWGSCSHPPTPPHSAPQWMEPKPVFAGREA